VPPQPGRQKYPSNSIQQISGAWDRPRFVVMGEKRSLDEIEHKIIRAEFEEPRIHMALVCAAVSCPPLRREPYRGAGLDAQLDDQARRFFADLRNLLIDRERGEVWASRIIGWFADDFAPGLRFPWLMISSHAHGEHHRRNTVSYSDGFGSPGLCDRLFGTAWNTTTSSKARPQERCSAAESQRHSVS